MHSLCMQCSLKFKKWLFGTILDINDLQNLQIKDTLR